MWPPKGHAVTPLRIDRYLHHVLQVLYGEKERGWRGLWVTPKQAAVFADRSIPKPATRGEAADMITDIAERERWEQ